MIFQFFIFASNWIDIMYKKSGSLLWMARKREREGRRTSFVNLAVAIEFPCCPRSDISPGSSLSLSSMCSSHGVWKPFRACNNKIAGAHTNASSAFQKPFYPLADCTSLLWRQITGDDKRKHRTYRRFRIIWLARCKF